MAARKMASATRRDNELERDELAGELHDAIRRLHAVVVAANTIMSRAQLAARGVKVARVLLVLAESLATETLELSGELQPPRREVA
jgi:hypothetical protein